MFFLTEFAKGIDVDKATNCRFQLLEKELPVSLRLMGIRLSSLSSRDEDEQKGVKRVGYISLSAYHHALSPCSNTPYLVLSSC
jgi:hypothetical protein